MGGEVAGVVAMMVCTKLRRGCVPSELSSSDNGWVQPSCPPDLLVRGEAFDIRDQPAYGVAEAARYVRLPAATLRSWLIGRDYPKADGKGKFHPLIKPASREPLQLSFYNLVEAHVLRALRTQHGVALAELRSAISYAEKKEQIDRLLLSPELRTHAGQVFLDRYVELINLSASGQLAIRKTFEDHLTRVEWDKWKFPVRLFPYSGATLRSEERAIVIDPQIAFGRPVVPRAGISVIAIADRIDAGESVDAVAEDYDLSHEEVEQAVLYTRAA
jgi:uncharacterized protein (DUF433 family)